MTIGWHCGPGGNHNGIGDYMHRLKAAGRPYFIKSVDHYGHVDEAVRVGGGECCFRLSTVGQGDGYNYDVPNYSLAAAEAANIHWQKTLAKLPPEFNKNKVWLEVINEVDKNRSDWLGRFGGTIGQLALRDGYKVALFGFAPGEPEPHHWLEPGMVSFLQLAALHPERIAVALHEYSLHEDLAYHSPYRVGRFRFLFDACDGALRLARPTTFITEFGWQHNSVPEVGDAMADLAWARMVYAPHAAVRGLAIWYLGSGYEGIANQAQKLIAPVTDYLLSLPPSPPPDPLPGPIPGQGEPRVQYKRTYVLLPPGYGRDWARAAVDGSWENKRYTIGGSADDGGIGNLNDREVIAVNPEQWGPGDDGTGLAGFYQRYYPGVRLNVLSAATPADLAALLSGGDPISDIDLTMPLSGPYQTTSVLNDERDYDEDGVYDDLHEGVDFAPRAPNSKVLAAAPGRVHRVNDYGGYGKHLILSHDNGRFYTLYAHMNRIDVVANQEVARSQPLGLVGSTGNSDGLHVHFNLQVPGHGLAGYVVPDIVNPLSYLNLTQINLGEHPVAIGLHASADPDISQGEINMFGVVRPEIIKVMSLHPENAVRQLATQHPAARFVIRAFLDFGGRNITPQQFLNDTLADVQRTIAAIGGGRDVVIELHNEPNLVAEGMGTSWADGRSFNNWFIQLLVKYRQALPASRFLFPGLSPGGDVPGIRQGHETFINDCRDAVLASDGLAVHLYWSNVYPISNALAVLDGYRGRFPAQAIWVTEACNNRPGPTAAQKGQEYLLFWQALRQRPLIRGVTYFVASASNPEWGWGPGGTGQTWLGTDTPAVVGGR